MSTTTINNTLKNTEIDSDRIVSNNENGIVSSNKKCWFFVPASNLSETQEYENGLYYNTEDVVEVKEQSTPESFLINSNDPENNYIGKAQYKFGFKIVSKKIIETYNEGAMISKEINLGNFSYITLEVDQECQNCSVEYYIVSGTTETSILPYGTEEVDYEKLFYNFPTRFTINQSTKNPVLYEDNVQSERNYIDLSYDDYEKHNYFLSYIPGGDNTQIIPSSKYIKLKIIIRKYDDNAKFILNSAIINKFGGALEWN